MENAISCQHSIRIMGLIEKGIKIDKKMMDELIKKEEHEKLEFLFSHNLLGSSKDVSSLGWWLMSRAMRNKDSVKFNNLANNGVILNRYKMDEFIKNEKHETVIFLLNKNMLGDSTYKSNIEHQLISNAIISKNLITFNSLIEQGLKINKEIIDGFL
jgi:hypothetical protein